MAGYFEESCRRCFLIFSYFEKEKCCSSSHVPSTDKRIPGCLVSSDKRGRQSKTKSFAQNNFQAFVIVMIEFIEMWNLRISAFYLMPNHYHLLVQTPDANISPMYAPYQRCLHPALQQPATQQRVTFHGAIQGNHRHCRRLSVTACQDHPSQSDIQRYSSVSSSIKWMRQQIDKDPELGKRVEQLLKRKRQKQTRPLYQTPIWPMQNFCLR